MFLFSLSSLCSAIGRTLIPRYFRSIFEGGATELYYVLKHPKESFHNNFVSLDCDQCTMVTQHGKPMFTQVRGIIVFPLLPVHLIFLWCRPPPKARVRKKRVVEVATCEARLGLTCSPELHGYLFAFLLSRCVWRVAFTWSSCLMT